MCKYFVVKNPDAAPAAELVAVLCAAISTWYVRRDEKFYDIDRLTVRLARSDVERACIRRIREG